ncbi:M56 family metallopeptidase [Maricurvus nonylphenolicus]|uniref:M56 family metallopeptidase n=1 Tax=Maricurvus nonylphenolicus TaxID=1008307 RepID=UPI0036F33E54
MTTLYLDYVSNLFIIMTSRQLAYTASLFMLVLCVCALLKDRHPRLQMTLWLLVFVRALIPAHWSTSFNLRHLLEQWLPQVKYFDPLFQLHQLDLIIHLSAPISVQFPYITWSMALLLAWISITTLLFIRLFNQRKQFRKIVQQSDVVTQASHLALFYHLHGKFKLRRTVSLVAGDANVSPFTIGTLRPVIYLPKEMLNSLDKQALMSVIAHEMAHIKRYDDLSGLARQLMQRVLFFFPVVWFTNRQIDEQKEIACDRMAVTSSKLTVGDYANSLLSIVKHFQNQSSVKVPSLSLRRQSYRARLLALKHYSIKGLSSGSLALSAALLTILFIMPMGSQHAISHTLKLRSLQALPEPMPLLSPPVQGGELYAGFHDVDIRLPMGVGKMQVFHDGLDFMVPVGSPVFAMADGKVIKVVDQPEDGIAMTSGGYVLIEHTNGIEASYHYVGNSSLQPNQLIKQGEQVGELLRVAFSPRDFPENLEQPRVPARVHISTRYQDVAIDPSQVIDLSQYTR